MFSKCFLLWWFLSIYNLWVVFSFVFVFCEMLIELIKLCIIVDNQTLDKDQDLLKGVTSGESIEIFDI